MKIKKNSPLILDGAMGTMLYKSGKLARGENPVTVNLKSPETVKSVHRAYLQAGADMILTNTFAANGQENMEEIIQSAIRIAKEAAEGFDVFVAQNIGPLGNSLEPLGTCDEAEAYEIFKRQVLVGAEAGADVIYIETMTDLNEARIAVRAARENCDLPVFCTMSFEENMRTFMGADIPSMAETLQNAGADSIGINCSVGPEAMLKMAAELKANTNLPIIIKPNAGLPAVENGEIVYNVTPKEFAAEMKKIIESGVSVVGGCCGTTPEFIKELKGVLK